MGAKKPIVENQKFGLLKTVKLVRIKKVLKWECLCECGKTTYVTASCLNSGNTKSCGCQKKIGINQKIDNGISKDSYYNQWRYHIKNGNTPYFDNIKEFKVWYKKEQKKSKKITKKLRDQWNKCISINQNGDFKDIECYCLWAYKKGYIDNIHSLHRKDLSKPHSKKNTEFGFFYKSKFISIQKFKKYNFKYNKNKNKFYGYIKYKGQTYTTKEYSTFESMLKEYSHLYCLYYKKNFKFT